MSIKRFVLDRIDEDEQIARAAICQCGSPVCTLEKGWYHRSEADQRLDSHTASKHVVRWSPARVVAECASKRSVVYDLTNLWSNGDCFTPAPLEDCEQMKLMAAAYSDHPEYDGAWAVVAGNPS